MNKRTPKYTALRGQVYWLHYKLPAAIYNNSNLLSPLQRISLNTNDPVKAGSLAQLLVFKIKELCQTTIISVNKKMLDDVIIKTLTNLGEATNKSVQRRDKKQHLTMKAAFKLYDDEMTRSGVWRVKTRCDNHAATENLIELIGDIYLYQLDTERCRTYKNKLIRFPIHRHKKPEFKTKTISEILNSKTPYQTISVTTTNNQIRKINSFFNWLTKQGFISKNPITGMKIKQTASPKGARTSFDTDDLRIIFSSDIFSNHKFLHDYQFWLPLLSLFSGARLEELCQLHLKDIHLDSTIPYYNINDEFDEQHLKNNSSRRCIPIHPELIKLGFKKFVIQKINQGETKLFGYLVPQRQQYGHKPSQWFSKYKKKLGIFDKRKVFHSFRHTIVDSLIQARTQDYEIKSLLGHKNGSVTHDIYGAIRTPLEVTFTTIKHLNYKEITDKIKPWEGIPSHKKT